MEFVYGAISLTFFVCLLGGTLWFKSREASQRTGMNEEVVVDIPRDTKNDAEAEGFIGDVTSEKEKPQDSRRKAFEDRLKRMADK